LLIAHFKRPHFSPT
jgi:hypothetical protein